MGAQLELVEPARGSSRGRNLTAADRSIRTLTREGRPLTAAAAALLRSSAEAADRAVAIARRERTPYAASVETAAHRELRAMLADVGLLPDGAGHRDPDDELLGRLLGEPGTVPDAP